MPVLLPDPESGELEVPVLDVPVGVVVEPGLLELVPVGFVEEVPTPLPGVVAPDVPVLDVPVAVAVDPGLLALVPFALVLEAPVVPVPVLSIRGSIGVWLGGALSTGEPPGRLAYIPAGNV